MAVMELPLTAGDVAMTSRPTGGDDVTSRWLDGDEAALRLAFDAWGAAIHTYCSRRVPTGEASDATQEVFVSAWRNRTQFDPTRGVLAQWLFGIARNTCVTFLRRSGRVPEPVAEVERSRALADSTEGLADRLLLAGALEQLPSRQRSVLVASFVDGLTNQEVADRLQVPLGTVKSDVRRGLMALRVILEGQG